MWTVDVTDEFTQWAAGLTDEECDSVVASIAKLERGGPSLGRPDVDTIKGSRHSNMKELRCQHRGSPLRMFFVFDPRRSAILLIGGDKTGDNRFYEKMIPVADDLYDVYLNELRKEGLI